MLDLFKMADADEKKVKLDAIDEEDPVVLKYQIENLKVALNFSNDALTAERKQKVSDRKNYEAKIAEVKTKYRKIYEDKVHEIEKFCDNKFMDINDEYEAKVKAMKDDHDKTLKLLQQPLSWHTLTDKSPQPSQEFVSRSHQTTPGKFKDNSVQTLAIQSANLSVQTESNEPDPDSSEVAAIEILQAEVEQLKRKVAELVFENNRYHLSLSNCTFCTSDDDFSDAALSEVSIRASTPLPSLDQGPAAVSSKIPALMSITWDRSQANNVQKSKDQTFINRMAKALTKLETKYKTPEHKRKKRLFMRKQKMSPIIPKEFSTIFHVLAAPEPDAVIVPDPFPHVRWSDVRFKPALPNPEQYLVHSCSPDAEFYMRDFGYLASPFCTVGSVYSGQLGSKQ